MRIITIFCYLGLLIEARNLYGGNYSALSGGRGEEPRDGVEREERSVMNGRSSSNRRIWIDDYGYTKRLCDRIIQLKDCRNLDRVSVHLSRIVKPTTFCFR